MLPVQVRLACPHCGSKLFGVAEATPRHVGCPRCKGAVEIPSLGALAAARAQQAAATPATAAPAPEPRSELIPVVCRLCKTRMYAQPAQVGQRLRCPDCYTETLVERPKERRRVERAPVDAYTLAGDGPRPPEQLLAMPCPLCHTRLHFPVSAAGSTATCPDCGRSFTVPQPRVLQRRAQPDLVAGEYGVGEAPSRAPATQPILREHRPAAAVDEASEPRWTFFSGVFTFPFRGAAALRWFYLSAGLLVVGQLVGLIAGLWLKAAEGNSIGGVAMAFPAIALLWVSLLTFSFGASCFLSIVQETAAGADDVESWADLDWRLWVLPLVYVAFAGLCGAALGYGAGRLIGGYIEVAVAAGIALLGPLVLVSTLETGSPLNPVSLPVWASLLRRWWAWLLYYLLSGVVVALAVAVYGGLMGVVGLQLAGLLGAPVAAAAWFIVARLLGRLVWRASWENLPDEPDEDA
ncbi:MAG: hypothetical protein K1X74_02325 [Pirellulales bacterium]|nr:hypothetical protein [Pirellulales bacterium]